ncbi:unnamed protein product [Penicillium nalgiovense]|nr:unnamed protein product [Penicillium nalgiovense]
MSSIRPCYDCGRQVRLSTTIQPPRCPACRLPFLPPMLETHPCLRCHVPVPASSSGVRCARCEAVLSLDVSYSPCYDCWIPFPSRPGVMRCFNCRSRRTNVVQRPVNFRLTYGTSFDPTMNSFELPNTPTNPSQRKRRRSLPRDLPPPTPASDTIETEDTSFVINRAVNFLLQEHCSRVAASSLFPPEISPSHIRLSVTQFEKGMALASRDITCSSCGTFVPTTDTRQVLDGDSLLRPLEGFLDRCGYIDGFWNLCSGCHAALLRGTAPKFSAENKVNVTLCQGYPDSLKDLTLTEEYLIAKSDPVGVIVKLRPGRRMSPANYHALRGHFIIIPQDPKPLLQILPSPDLQFTEVIKVFWLGNRAPTDDDLRPFLIVRKSKVLAALQYHIQHNPLYGDVTVAHSTIYNWPDEFIPSDLQQQVISLDGTDHNERVGYSVNLQEGNYENDWQAAEDSSGHLTENPLPVTASVTVDVNGERQNPDLRLLNTMNTLIDDSSPGVQPRFTPAGHSDQAGLSSPVIEYGVRGQALLLNQWQDHHYFTSAFPTLFPMGTGGPGRPGCSCVTCCFRELGTTPS